MQQSTQYVKQTGVQREIDPRVKALYRYQILQTPSEAFFKNVADTVTCVFHCKLGIISFIDDAYVFYKEVVVKSNSIPDFTGAVMPLSLSPCAFAVHGNEVTVMDRYPAKNAPEWEAYNLQVTKFGLRFYAGIPLRTADGYNIGMLALVDEDVRLFTDSDRVLLKNLAKIVVDELELRLSALNEIQEHKRVNLIIEDQNKLITTLNRELQTMVAQLKESNDQLVSKISDKSKKLTRVRKALVISQKEMDALVYNASHGLKSPITTIDGLINLAKTEVTDQTAKEYLKHIEIFSRKMKGTVHKLTMIYDAINRTDEGGFDIVRMNSLDFNKIAEEVIAIFKGELTQRGINVNVTVSKNISFAGISTYVQYILFNLFENSVTFSVNRKEGLQASHINITIDNESNGIVLSVCDNGEGIPEKCHNKIFSMFYRASARSGPGLGLYIVKKIVDKLEGVISFKSIENSFSHFKVKLPSFS